MTIGRAVSAVTATAAVAGGAVLVLSMSHAQGESSASRHRPQVPVQTSRPAYLPLTVGAASTPAHSTRHPGHRAAQHSATSSAATPSSSTHHVVAPVTQAATRSTTSASTPTTPAPSTSVSTSAASTSVAITSATATPTAGTSAPASSSAASSTPAAPSTSTASHAPATPHQQQSPSQKPRGHKLPLHFRTHDARRVITVVADNTWDTTATFQAWHKVPGGWAKHGGAVEAHVGTDGLSRHASESKSATPIGSFTLTHAFGRDANPGTRLPYFKTNPSDWWISQAGPLYNTHQRCSSGCNFTQGSPNEHLYYETPYYNYAVVIDYNTKNSPTGVRQGRGSAFFLHVHPRGTGGTAGCVDIPQPKLKRIMRWLKPGAHPRILIGVN